MPALRGERYKRGDPATSVGLLGGTVRTVLPRTIAIHIRLLGSPDCRDGGCATNEDERRITETVWGGGVEVSF